MIFRWEWRDCLPSPVVGMNIAVGFCDQNEDREWERAFLSLCEAQMNSGPTVYMHKYTLYCIVIKGGSHNPASD